MIRVTSYGAAERVTGSCHLLEVGTLRILIDCGMFQGEEMGLKNYRPFGFDPASVDYLLLTHAHIDHIGRVAKLVKEGFRGEIISTEPTREIAKVMLLDSARILEEEYRTLQTKARRRGEEALVVEPLYAEEHVECLFAFPWHTLEYGESYTLRHRISVTLGNAGHIMGSAFVTLECGERGRSRRVVFSGDLGSPHRLIIDAADTVAEADALFIESTYGDRNHKPLPESVAEFKRVVIETLERDGNVLIPSFALERTQEILWLLHEMYEKQQLPKCRVFLDSPLAIRATELYNKYPIHLSAEVELQALGGQDPFAFPWLEATPDREHSRAINRIEERAVIIAGSGMCSGGRIMHHLKHRLWDPHNAVIFVGFQAEGTLGRELVEGAEYVGIYGEGIIVRAAVHTINGFSAHADQKDLIGWMGAMGRLGAVYLIHGEAEKMACFAGVIRERLGLEAHIMKEGESITF